MASYPKEFIKAKFNAWSRDSQVCKLCGFDFKKDDKTLKKIVHHIDHNPSNNKFKNLVVLCSDCHMKVHTKLYSDEFKHYRDFTNKKYVKVFPFTKKCF
jgi:5-methylcytosine-specific restriction endonuclease McrA